MQNSQINAYFKLIKFSKDYFENNIDNLSDFENYILSLELHQSFPYESKLCLFLFQIKRLDMRSLKSIINEFIKDLNYQANWREGEFYHILALYYKKMNDERNAYLNFRKAINIFEVYKCSKLKISSEYNYALAYHNLENIKNQIKKLSKYSIILK